MTIEDVVARAAAAAEHAHAACAKLDRMAFRQSLGDPTPHIWFAHHITNQAFKALVESRQAATQAKFASLHGDEDGYRHHLRAMIEHADLATYLANVVDTHILQTQKELDNERAGARRV